MEEFTFAKAHARCMGEGGGNNGKDTYKEGGCLLLYLFVLMLLSVTRG